MPGPSAIVDTSVIYCGDNIDQLSRLPDACVDLIYIDPPFNSNRNYEVFWGETKEKRAFDDRHASTEAYIGYMRPRCEELHRTLKPTGSFYYHCDWHASHYIKVMLDQIFGENKFINEIIWQRTSAHNDPRQYGRVHDTILYYSGGHETKRTWNQQYDAIDERFFESHDFEIDEQGRKYPTQKPIALLDRIITTSSNENDIVLDAFCGCGTAIVSAQNLKRQWIGIDISPTACRVMAKRLRDDCGLPEDEKLWKVGRGFVVRDLPWSEEKLRKIPPFEFENWAVIALGGIPNKTQTGDMGIDGRIYPASTSPAKKGKATGHLDFMDDWYPVQVKQKDKAGRPDIDAFEAMMARADRKKGFFVSFAYSSDALTEIDAFFRKSGRIIIPLTVREILDEQIAKKLA